MEYPCGTTNGTLNGRVCINKLFIILLLSRLWATHITHSLVQTFPEFHTNVKGLGQSGELKE